MGIAENKGVVRRFIEECVNTHRSELLPDYVDPGLRAHPGTPGAAPDTEGLDALREAFQRFRTAFPDLHITPEEMVAEGDLVAVRWTATGTHSGDLAGIAATGTAVRWAGTDMYRLTAGRIVEWWRNDDSVWLLHQLGRDLVPEAAGPGRRALAGEPRP
jgi:predicted ester cyclase